MEQELWGREEFSDDTIISLIEDGLRLSQEIICYFASFRDENDDIFRLIIDTATDVQIEDALNFARFDNDERAFNRISLFR